MFEKQKSRKLYVFKLTCNLCYFQVLTASVPKEIEEIESWLGESKQEDSDVLRKPFIPGRKVGVY